MTDYLDYYGSIYYYRLEVLEFYVLFVSMLFLIELKAL
jgi:hypothetical protein